MKYSIILLLLVCSCAKPQPFPVTTNYNIINETNHKIEIVHINSNSSDTLNLLRKLDTVMYSYSEDAFISPPPFLADSVFVVYDDTISITHIRIQGQDIRKNIFNEDSWLLSELSDYERTYEYIFTEEDYLEAKEQ